MSSLYILPFFLFPSIFCPTPVMTYFSFLPSFPLLDWSVSFFPWFTLFLYKPHTTLGPPTPTVFLYFLSFFFQYTSYGTLSPFLYNPSSLNILCKLIVPPTIPSLTGSDMTYSDPWYHTYSDISSHYYQSSLVIVQPPSFRSVVQYKNMCPESTSVLPSIAHDLIAINLHLRTLNLHATLGHVNLLRSHLHLTQQWPYHQT